MYIATQEIADTPWRADERTATASGALTSSEAEDEAGVIVIAGKRYSTRKRLAKKVVKRSERTLARWDEQGIGPPKIKIGSMILYDEAKLPGWLAKFERQPVRLRRRGRRPGTGSIA